MGLANVDLNNISLDNDNFDDNDPKIIIHIRLMAQCNEYKQSKACKKEIGKTLMPVARNPKKWWDWCMSEDESKNGRNGTIFC